MSAAAQPGAGSAAPAGGRWTRLSGRMILASGLLMLVLIAQFGAARVRHPNAAAVHDSIEQEGSDWLVMD